jgi:hypothetical protein
MVSAFESIAIVGMDPGLPKRTSSTRITHSHPE